MLVVEKAHHISVKITGPGAEKAAAALAREYPKAKVYEDETESLRGSGWFEKMESALTAGLSLRVYRDNAGLSQAELSKKAGIPVPHISAMEHDKRPIGRTLALRLAKALNCDYRRLLSAALPRV